MFCQKKIIPVIEYNNILLLFDTGASTPVRCSGDARFIRKFPSARKMNYKFLLTGFGRSEEELLKFMKNPSSNEFQNYFASSASCSTPSPIFNNVAYLPIASGYPLNAAIFTYRDPSFSFEGIPSSP